MTVVAGPGSWNVAKAGMDPEDELVVVPVAPGSRMGVKMKKSEAIAKGLYKEPEMPKAKRRKRKRDKRRRPEGDK